MKRILTAMAMVAVCFPVFSLQAEEENASGKEYLYVLNTDDGTVSVIAIPEHEEIGRIEVGPLLDDLEISSDGRVLYINRMNSMGHPLDEAICDSGEIVAISTETEQELWRAPLEDGWPHHPALSKDDKTLYVPRYDGFYIDVIDTESGKVTGKFPSLIGSHVMKVSPDGNRLYVGSMMMDALMIYDLTKDGQIIGALPFRDAVRPFAFTKDEQTFYVQLSWLHGFIVVDMETGETKTIHLPELAEDVETPEIYPHTWNHGIAITPDEKLLFANGSVADYTVVYSLPDLEQLAVIEVGDDPNYIAFDEAGRFAYVTNRGSDDLSIIDVGKLEEVKRMKLGDFPQRMQVAHVPNRNVAENAETATSDE